MRWWRTLFNDRLGELRSMYRTWPWTQRYSSLIAVFVLLLVTLSGCGGGGLRHESWPGLTVDEGTIFAANLERVQAFNAETGKLLWSYPDEADKNLRPFYSTPVLAKDYGDYGLLLMAGYKDKTVYALALGESRAERPDIAWTFDQASGQYVGSGIVADGKFIIGNGDGSVYAINLDDGTAAWTFVTKDRVWATPVVVEDTIYIASLDHSLYAVDLATGEKQWELEMAGAIAATPVFVNGDLWVGDFSATLYQVDLESRSVAWTYTVQDWLWATPIIDNTTLYFADVGGHVYALDVTTREMVWNEPAFIEDVLRGRPALNDDGSLLYVAGYEKGEIHALDTRTGSEMNWGIVARNPGRLPGDLVADSDRVYAMPVLVQERIQALEPGTGKILWQYPVPETE
jgi:outer membrane protein assembly factor BamB